MNGYIYKHLLLASDNPYLDDMIIPYKSIDDILYGTFVNHNVTDINIVRDLKNRIYTLKRNS